MMQRLRHLYAIPGAIMGKWLVWIAAGLVLLFTIIGASGMRRANGTELATDTITSLIEDNHDGLSYPTNWATGSNTKAAAE